MRIENTLFLQMIGDFYLHAYVLNHSEIVKNNKTSLIIEEMFENMSNSICGQLFKVGNKVNIITAVFKLDIENNISFQDMYDNNISEFIGLISPFDGIFYSDVNELIKQANSHRVANGICYLVINGDIKQVIDLTESLSKVSASETIKSIVNKILLFSPENERAIVDIVSILFGAPYCMSPEGEIVKSVESNKVITDKNIYNFTNAVSLPNENQKLSFCEPVVKLCSINNNAIKYNINYIKLSKVLSYNNDIYNKNIIESIKNNLIYIDIPIEIASEYNDILKDVSIVLKNLKIIFTESISSKKSDDLFNVKELSSNVINDKSIFDAVERHYLKTYYFVEESSFEYFEKSSNTIKNSSDVNYNENTTLNSIKNVYSTINFSENEHTIHIADEEFSIYEETEKKSLLKTFIISDINENSENIIEKEDINDIFKDSISISSFEDEKIVTLEKTSETIFSKTLDYMLSQTDYINILSKSNDENIMNSTNNQIGDMSREDKLESYDSENVNIVSNSELSNSDDVKNINIDKNNISIYNINSFETKSIEIEMQIIKSDDELTVETNELLGANDEMIIDSNTNIDKE